MKIKPSFIPNSSSTIYIIFVPDNFLMEDEYILNICEDNLNDFEDHDSFENFDQNKFIEEIQNQFESFKEGKQYIFYDCSAVEMLEWRTLVKICENNNLIIDGIDFGISGNDVIKSISQETIIAALTNYINLDEFIKPFIREKKDDTEITKKI